MQLYKSETGEMRKNAALLINCVLLMLSVSGLTLAENDGYQASLPAVAALIIPTIYMIKSMLTAVSFNHMYCPCCMDGTAVFDSSAIFSGGRSPWPPVVRDDGGGSPNGKFPPGSIQRSCALCRTEIRKCKLYLRTILDFFLKREKEYCYGKE